MRKEGSSRQTILLMLKRHKERTVAELAKGLGITEMAVRKYLHSLEREGVIESRIERQAMGRPSHHYFLTLKGEESFPRQYCDLSLQMLQDLEELSGSDIVAQLFEKRKERLHDKYVMHVTGSFNERIKALARIQSDNGYMVEYEKMEDGSYRFIEYNCPIARIAKRYPVACSCELQLFKQLLKTNHVVQVTCMAKDGGNCCTYSIRENESKEERL